MQINYRIDKKLRHPTLDRVTRDRTSAAMRRLEPFLREVAETTLRGMTG